MKKSITEENVNAKKKNGFYIGAGVHKGKDRKFTGHSIHNKSFQLEFHFPFCLVRKYIFLQSPQTLLC